eukprot:gb/GEZN01002308.1/.p1 GENE.gb/GEZN01002308.1/~~gb/GEZN01002308.1/.p1  ORF type:complete len:670 (-),score=123.12 gb/GEZN01002308.1/:480-2489(-)
MARSKQTARKSTGGKAPRKQLATCSARSFRKYMVTQQPRLGTSSEQSKHNIFINCENTLSEFRFRRPQVEQDFGVAVSVGRIRDLPRLAEQSTTDKSDLYLRLDFGSRLDGKGIDAVGRPPLDVCFVLDKSGSMSLGMGDDVEPKWAAAKKCLGAILQQLSPQDRVAITLFNQVQQVLAPMQLASTAVKKKLSKQLEMVDVGGGTDLGNGLLHGMELLDKAKKSEKAARMRWVMFLTDMDSDSRDEEDVLNHAKAYSSKGIFTTLVGVGVDLSAATINALSAIKGAKYISVLRSSEFMHKVAEEFSYDVTPLAFDISLTLPPGLSFSKCYGSPELNLLAAGSTTALISTEFPVPLDRDNTALGGIYVFKLKEEKLPTNTSDPAPPPSKKRKTRPNAQEKQEKQGKQEKQEKQASSELVIRWTCPSSGKEEEQRVELALPKELAKQQLVSQGCEPGLRKAVALTRYVHALTDYSTSEATEPTGPIRCSLALAEKLRGMGAEDLLTTTECPVGTPEIVKRHHANAMDFNGLRSYLLEEMAVAGDTSLALQNQNILQTVAQVSVLETAELRKAIANLHSAGPAVPASANPAQHMNSDQAPRGFICPITQEVMKDPVMAADGHSYERVAIERWLQDKITSPCTNLSLPHKLLVENRALKSSIEDFFTNAGTGS